MKKNPILMILSLGLSLFSIGMGINRCTNPKQNSYSFTQYKNIKLPEEIFQSHDYNEKVKIPVIRVKVKEYLDNLYPGTKFTIKKVTLLSNKPEGDIYQTTAYIDDPVTTTDTIFYQCRMTIAKMDIASLLRDKEKYIARINITDFSGLVLKEDE
jgi:hypothetical protein